jgi:hypothetical protein
VQRSQNLRQFAKVDVDDRADDLSNRADAVLGYVFEIPVPQSASAPEMISISSLVMAAWRVRL